MLEGECTILEQEIPLYFNSSSYYCIIDDLLPSGIEATDGLPEEQLLVSAGSQDNSGLTLASITARHLHAATGLGHTSLREMARVGAGEIKNLKSFPQTFEGSIAHKANARMRNLSFQGYPLRERLQPLQMFQTDTKVGLPVALNGERYLQCACCRVTGLGFVQAFVHKAKVHEIVDSINLTLKSYGKSPVQVWSLDQAGENRGKPMMNSAAKGGGRLIFGSVEQHNHQTTVERFIGTIVRMIISMLHRSCLPDNLWPWAARLSVFYYNKTPKRGEATARIQYLTGEAPITNSRNTFVF